MQSRGTIVVIAAEGGLRSSYEFGLSVEGFDVRAFGTVDHALEAEAADGAVCVLIDDTALAADPDPVRAKRLDRPVALLVSGFAAVPEWLAARSAVLTKPLRENELLACVQRFADRVAT